MRRTRLLVVGQGLRPTGYARVMESVLSRLAGRFDATLFALDHLGPDRAGAYVTRGNRLVGDRYGREQLPRLLDELRPDVVLIHHDARLYGIHRPAFEARREVAVVVYCPVDWPVVRPGVAAALAGVDLVVAYHRSGRDALAAAFGALGVRPPPLAVVPHGVDADRFRPLGSARDAEAFVVLNANRNVPRKRIDLTLEGFAAFAERRPRARLHLHMAITEDVERRARALGIADRLRTTTRSGEHPHVDDEALNRMYNACAVGINTSAAEGWGLVAFEHAATGAPQVVAGHGGSAALWRDHALVLDAHPSPADVAGALGQLHDDGRLRHVLGRRARERATAPDLHWDAVAARWADLLAEVASRTPSRRSPSRR